MYLSTYVTYVPDTYDVSMMMGGLVRGHIKLDVFDEMIRVTKPGIGHNHLFTKPHKWCTFYGVPLKYQICRRFLYLTKVSSLHTSNFIIYD